MYYILQTNLLSRNLGISLAVRDNKINSIDLQGFECKAKTKSNHSIKKKLITYQLDEPIDFEMKTDEYNIRGSSLKKLSSKRVPDFWINDPLPLVTRKFKNLLEQHDTITHQFFPLTLYKNKTNELIEQDEEFFLFACCRMINITQNSSLPEEQSVVEAGGILDQEKLHRYKTIQANPDVQSTLSLLPICRDYNHRSIHYLSETFLLACQNAGLSGFKLSSFKSGSFTRRDVGYIYY
ncbi:imm11 family protein [Pseudovibrio denitrificans]|uniref:imm11 family protein n=1 Tax=Pseudovibrio denitrificans TaxID=258256 RepID=UPI0039BEE5CF